MLKKFILGAAVTATAFTFSASASSAEQFRVMVMDQAFFPEISYLSLGDEVIFVNMSGSTLDIAAKDDSWEVTGLVDGAEASLITTQGIQNKFRSTGINGEFEGRMNFSLSPDE